MKTYVQKKQIYLGTNWEKIYITVKGKKLNCKLSNLLQLSSMFQLKIKSFIPKFDI